MQNELLKLQEHDDVKALQNYVENLDVKYVCSELDTICTRENGSVVLQILLNAISSTASSQEKRMKIVRKVVQNIEDKSIPAKLTEKLVGVLSTQMDSFSASNIITLIDYCLQMMRESNRADGYSCWKDLIPKLLNKVVEEDFIEHNGSRMKGSEYKSEVIIAICLFDWPDGIVTDVASMFIDVSLTSEEHLKVVNKLCKGISTINMQEIPPLVHQMLQLTKEQHFMPLFLALAQLFEEKIYSNSSNHLNNGLKEIQAVEGTVLYHIYSTVSTLGPHSVKDFLKTLKECANSPGFILTPFTLTLLLCISCVSYTFEEEVLSIIKSAILRNFVEEEKILDSAWIDSVVPAVVPINDIFEKIILNSSRERDKVVKGLINLGFSLLSTHKLRGREVQCEKIWSLASFIMIRITNKYSDLTGSILQTLANQIPQVHESTQYTDLLFHVIRKNPITVIDCSTVMIQLLDTICGKLPGSIGRRVIAVILPLTKMSHSFRDNLIILLRKSLFSRNRECREMAVVGMLELLKNLKISNLRTLSQSISQSYRGLTQIYSQACADPAASNSNEGLCLELLYILREVFKHQHEVKTVFYRGLYESVYVNPELGCHALDSLQNQFDQFYRPGNDIPPLDFEKTVAIHGNNPVLLEPLAHLTLSIGLILAKVEESSSGCLKLREMFDSLCQRMSDSDIPHFILGKEPCDGSTEGSVKEEEVRQILGVYEALMGYTVCTWTKDSSKHGEMLSSLFRAFCRLADFTRNLGKPDKKDKGKGDGGEKKKEKSKASPFKFPSSVMNFKCVCRMLSILYENSLTWASEESVAPVKNKRELHRYCLNATLTLLKQAKLVPATELSKDSPSLGYLTKIGRVIFTKCVQRVGEMIEFDRVSAVLVLECFAELIQLVLSNFQEKFTAFFGDICGNANIRVSEQLKSVIIELLEQLNTVLKDDLEDDAKEEEAQIRKTSILLVTICTALSGQLVRGTEAQQVLERVKRICKEVKVESPTVAKSVLCLLLNLYSKTKCGSLLLDLTLCLCDNMPLIDDEMKVVEHTVYKIVNSKTANSCVIAVCDALRVHVNQVEWIVARLKSELLILSHSTNNSEKNEDLCERERELCRQITYSMRILSLLCTMAIPPGVYADAVLKELGNFYNKLTTVTKYFILKVGKYHHQLLDSKFDKTVKLVDHDLSKNMYCFTEHVIADGTTGIEQSKKDPTFLKNKSLRETKIIPKVIFEKEQFQKFVIQLSNKAKINMVGQTKYALARDYRLYAKQVKEILEKENIQLDDVDMENDDAERDEEEQDSKRPRLED
ncbi:UNVERIFIED_CONTAM: hypothetical protein PYX00_007013 [Menopon gallinae]|uniref:Fanconi anemia group I protein n=1 Tax=Menopon gallinae TaxID=328185 RepID=A0AAW2HHQ6_9NEOP